MIHVQVRAYGDLRRYLPEAERAQGKQFALPPQTTVAQLLESMQIPTQATWMIYVNEAAVDLTEILHDGDMVELMLPIGGGIKR